MTIIRALIAAGLVTAVCFAAPASAQRKAPSAAASPADVEKRRNAEIIDQQYRDTLEKTRKPADTKPQDPWQNLRTDDPKTKR